MAAGGKRLKEVRITTPVTDEDIANAAKPFESGEVKEVDALVVYLQQLGTLLTRKR